VYAVREAAKAMGITDRHLRLLLQSGQVKGKKLGRDWVVLSLEYDRKRAVKGNGIRTRMLLPDSYVTKGKRDAETKDEGALQHFVKQGHKTVRNLEQELVSKGVPAEHTTRLVRAAVKAGVLAVFSFQPSKKNKRKQRRAEQ
jgi:hypothetical protein